MSSEDSGAPNSSPSDGAEPSSQMRWQFIDSSNNRRSNLTQVKRHVMQEFMRQKRQGSGQSRQDDDEEEAEGQKAPPPKPRRPRKTRASSKAAKVTGKRTARDSQRNVGSSQDGDSDDDVIEIDRLPPQEPAAPSASSDHSSRSDSTCLTPSSTAATSPFERCFSPKSILGAARTDPFNSLPMELDLEGQRLFDFYVQEMPACSYGTHFRSPNAHNWYTMVFVPEGMKGAVAFQNTILVHAANTWAWVRNEEETDYTLTHRSRAITMLREYMADNPGVISDVAIIACLSAAGLEDFDPRPGRKSISWMHMRAARAMIRARGGPVAFANTRLGMLINWQDYILSGYETNGPSFFFEPCPVSHVSPTTSTSPPTTEGSRSGSGSPPLTPKDEIQHQCNEFIDFLHRCETLARYQSTQPTAYNIDNPNPRQAAFHPTSLLYNILAAPPGMRFTATGDRKQFVARMVALIILNAALWDYRFSPAHTATFLTTLEQALLTSEVSTSGSVEALLQILLECKDGIGVVESSSSYVAAPDYTQYSSSIEMQTPYGRPWFAGRMLKVVKRLGRASWMAVHDFLFDCLALRVGGLGEVVRGAWEGVLRREVLSAPLTCYVMPALEGF